MTDLLRFCQSTTGSYILIGLFFMLNMLLGVMCLTTLLHWLIRFVKAAWE